MYGLLLLDPDAYSESVRLYNKYRRSLFKLQFTRIITLLATLTVSSFASVVYDFSYAATYGSVSDFSWRLTSSTYLTDSTSLNFTPFIMTAGENTFELSKGNLYSRCFTFASVGTSLSNCSASPTPGNGLIQFGFYEDFDAPGTYTSMLGVAGGVTSNFQSVNGGGIVTLVISEDDSEDEGGSGGGPGSLPETPAETPEPASMALFGSALAAGGFFHRLRRKQSRQ
jgi:hypothetical protein